MADAAIAAEAAPRKRKGLLPLILGAVGALVLGAGGFFVTYSGLLFGAPKEVPQATKELAGVGFVPLPPLVISLGDTGRSKHLRFAAQLEVDVAHKADVELLQPRILDVLNGYLRAVEATELEDPTALIRLRAQMLRRLQIVTGEGHVRDLLITEFVLN
jgi:flagellar FliL protein